MSTNPKKRRTAPVALEENPEKRARLASESPASNHPPCKQPSLAETPNPNTKATSTTNQSQKNTTKPQESRPGRKRVKINKLAPPKPFPAVAASASATGPRSAQKEGKNYICLTRKTSLGAYMRRCKNLVINDGYKDLHLHAAGAAIPLLLQLSCALPPILPFSKDEIHTDISTGTVDVQDEIIPDDEEEDLSYRTRGKSTLYVIIRIGDGQGAEKDGPKAVPLAGGSNPKPSRSRPKPKKTTRNQEIVVFDEPEQEQEDI